MVTTPGAFQTSMSSSTMSQAFISAISDDGSRFIYSTFDSVTAMSMVSIGRGIAVDSAGDAFIAGSAGATMPTTAGALRTTFAGGTSDGFVAKFTSTGSTLSYGTYVGGLGDDSANAIAVDRAGDAYITGTTANNFMTGWSFATTTAAYQSALNGGSQDAF